MRETIIGLAMVALTALGFYFVSRRRYKCPICGAFVQWKDVNCPHCGNDMKYKHRAGPEALPRAAAELRKKRTPRG